MLRIAPLALMLLWPSVAAAQPTTDAGIDTARADIARFCAAEIQTYVKARKAEADPNAKKTPEEEVIEKFEYMFDTWASPPDLNLQAYVNEHAESLKGAARDRTSDPWLKKILAEDRLRICMGGRAIKHYGEHETYIVVQNKTKSTAKFMSRNTNWGEMAPGETMVYRFSRAFSAAFRINVDGVDAYGPTTIEMKPRETIVLSFGDAGDALTVAQPPPLD